MSEVEKDALQTIIEAVPKMSDFQKGRLYGIAERMEEENQEKEKSSNIQNE